MRRLFILLIFISFSCILFAQNISSQIDLVKKQIETTSSKTLKAQYYIKLANLYQQLDSISKAIEAYKNSLNLIQNSKNYLALYQLNTYLGVLYSEQGHYQQAINYFDNSVKYAKRLNNKHFIANSLFNKASTLMALKRYNEALAGFEEALTLAFDIDNLVLVKKAYADMALCYKKLGDQNKYLKYFNLSVAIDRKIKEQLIKQKEQEARRQAQIARQKQLMLELQRYKTKTVEDSLNSVKQQNEKNKMKIALLQKDKKLKELQIKRREAELRKKEAELRERQVIIFSLLVFLAIIFVASLLIYKLYSDKKLAYKKLEELYKKLEAANKKLKEQNDLILKQKQELEAKNKQIAESIEYASRIQKAILPSRTAIEASFPAGSFIFYEPRDVVSGDFYWFSQQGNYLFLALVDCTGHSVPGAFMSLIGNTLLNEIINSKRIFDPSQVLDRLHQEVVKLLHQKTSDVDSVNDGMDIALCRFDTTKNELTFAGANQPLFVVRSNGELSFMRGDIFSIGGYSEIEVHFTNKSLNINNGDNIYLTSDGYLDQFSEQDRQKFSRKRFITLLKQIYNLPMKEQEKIVVKTFEDWKGAFRQIDDVLVIGVRYLSSEASEELKQKIEEFTREKSKMSHSKGSNK